MVGRERIYVDNAATTRVDPAVLAEMLPYFTQGYGNPSSLHIPGENAREAIDGAREIVAAKINASPEEIVFTSGGSESDNLALKGIAYGLKHEGDHIITSQIEHPAVLNTCKSLEKDGFRVTYLPVDGQGFVDRKALDQAIDEKTLLVSIMHANNEIGTIQDIREIGKVCSENDVLFHSDIVQSFTKVPIDVKTANIALASCSSHKIHGPKGVGGLFVREDVKRKMRRMIDGGGQEYGLRAGTENVPGIAGFGKAVELVKEEEIKKMIPVRDYLITEALKLPDSFLNGPPGDARLPNNVNVSFKHIEGESILLMLDAKGVSVSTGSACSSKSLDPSHVLTAIGRRPEESHGSVRMTLSRYNTMEEARIVAEALTEVVEKLRKMSPFT
ncbi:cysteine desulfurase family protein [Candidatus Altiarchaeota archaeon]